MFVCLWYKSGHFILSLNELKLVAKGKGIKDSILKEKEINLKPKPKISHSKNRIKKIRKKINELEDRLSKPEIKEIKRNLYKIKKQKKFPHQK